MPRVGIGTPLALAVALVALLGARRAAAGLDWRWLLLSTWLASAAWLFSLALIDGPGGIWRVLEHRYEYLPTARTITDVPAALAEFVDRIPYDHPQHWQVHTAGHPPGAVLFFVLLDRLGLGSGGAAGVIVALIAATTAPGVLTTLKALGAEAIGRRAAPLLVFGPAAIWMAVSGDALFGAVSAWGMALLATAGSRRSVGLGAAAGMVLGCCVMFSYGLILLGPLALVVLWRAGSWRPLIPAVLGAGAVVAAYGAFGFWWWEGLAALRGRYWAGVASNRPPEYWMWGNLAALCFSAGPAVAVAIPDWWRVLRSRAPSKSNVGAHTVAWLVAASWAAVVIADFSQMSRAEVERIWLPFVPWLLLATALLPDRWQRRLLALQVLFTLALAHLLWTDW